MDENMTITTLPGGEDVQMCHTAAVAVWSLYFAHAREGMGLKVEKRGEFIELTSIYAPLWWGCHARVNLSTGVVETLEYDEQQSPIGALLRLIEEEAQEKHFMSAARRIGSRIQWQD